MVGILRPCPTISLLLAGFYHDDELLGQILEGIGCQCRDGVAGDVDSGQRCTAAEGSGGNGF